MIKKLIRKPLGNDKLIINILSLKPIIILCERILLVATSTIFTEIVCPRKKQSRLVIDLPYRDYVLGVYVSSLSNDRFRAKVFLKSDKFYMSATGNSPMTSFAQTNASGVSGGGNIATTQATSTPSSSTSVVITSIVSGIVDKLNATYVNAYAVVMENGVQVQQSDDGVSGWNTMITPLFMPTSPYRGSLSSSVSGLIFGKYYRIVVANSLETLVYSNVVLYN